MHRLILLLLALLAGLGLTSPVSGAQANDDTSDVIVEPVQPTKVRVAPGQGSGEVQVTVRSLGVGAKARAGEWVGLHLDIIDNGLKPRNILLRMSLTDADGDSSWWQRVPATNPGERQSPWIYARLPSNASRNMDIPVTAYEAIDSDSPDPTTGRKVYVPGKLLGSTIYRVNQDLDYDRSYLGVVGTADAALGQYMWPAVRNQQFPPQGHEHTELASSLGVGNLPDAWMGLMTLEALVWTGNDPVLHQPGRLVGQQAQAIKEWVRRGGHLIIVLPPAGQTWYQGETHVLKDILPAVTVKRSEGVSLDAYRALITREANIALPENVVVQSFEPESSAWQEATPIMQGPSGDTVVVRRLVGAGAVTVIGIDVSSPKLRDGLLQADLFWHRVLGKRIALPTPINLDNEMKGGSKANGSVTAPAWSANTTTVVFDAGFNGLITKGTTAAAGVMLALLIFAGYWLIAGPVGFLVLRKRGWIQHSWVAFAGAAGIFTAIAWGGASALKIRRVEGQHLTILDGVYGQPMQRARSWMSLFLPRYGEQRVAMAATDAGTESLDVIAPWDPPPAAGGSGFSAFPDARGYAIDSRTPQGISFPARATVRQVQADWSGGVPAAYGMPVPVGATGQAIGSEIRFGVRDYLVEPGPGMPKWMLDGALVHALPKALDDVRLILIRGQAPGRQLPGSLLSEAYEVAYGTWKPGEQLRLNDQFKNKLAEMGMEKPLWDLTGRASSAFGGGIANQTGIGAWEESLRALSFYNMLTPPQSEKYSPNARNRVVRQLTHGYDLSRWMTQPCLIVMGFMEDVEVPVPVKVDSMSVQDVRERVRGRVMVRWVYPLSPMPIRAGVLAPGSGTESDDPLPASKDDGV